MDTIIVYDYITLLSVSQVRRDCELDLVPGAGAEEPELPPVDDEALAQLERDGVAALARVEDLEELYKVSATVARWAPPLTFPPSPSSCPV